MKRTTNEQKRKSNTPKAKAAANAETLQDVALRSSPVTYKDRGYPWILTDDRKSEKVAAKNRRAQVYYDMFIDSFNNMSIMYQYEQDCIQVANLAKDFVTLEDLQWEIDEYGPILREMNGNTMAEQTKANPALSEYTKLHKMILQILASLGATPKERAIMWERMSNINSQNAVSNEMAQGFSDDDDFKNAETRIPKQVE